MAVYKEDQTIKRDAPFDQEVHEMAGWLYESGPQVTAFAPLNAKPEYLGPFKWGVKIYAGGKYITESTFTSREFAHSFAAIVENSAVISVAGGRIMLSK